MTPETEKQTVELFHLLFLQQLGTRMDKHLNAVKGGCNLRFFFKSIRYSKDLDLDVHTTAKETLRKNVNQILKFPGLAQILRTHGLEISFVSEPKQTETTQRWKIHLRTDNGGELPTKIEFSRRSFDESVAFEAVDPEITRLHRLRPILTTHYTLEAAFAQKVEALIHRAETQARDVSISRFYSMPAQRDRRCQLKHETKGIQLVKMRFPSIRRLYGAGRRVFDTAISGILRQPRNLGQAAGRGS